MTRPMYHERKESRFAHEIGIRSFVHFSTRGFSSFIIVCNEFRCCRSYAIVILKPCVLGHWRQTGRQGFSQRAFERSVDLLQGDSSTTINEQPDYLVMSSS
jgi:hypothetical protein